MTCCVVVFAHETRVKLDWIFFFLETVVELLLAASGSVCVERRLVDFVLEGVRSQGLSGVGVSFAVGIGLCRALAVRWRDKTV